MGWATRDEVQRVNWEDQMPRTTKKEVEAVLEKRVSKRTREQTYFQYLVKWRGQRLEMLAGWQGQSCKSME